MMYITLLIDCLNKDKSLNSYFLSTIDDFHDFENNFLRLYKVILLKYIVSLIKIL